MMPQQYSRATADASKPSSRAILTPRLHQRVAHARQSDFPKVGRKFRVNQERDRRVFRALGHFERGSGVWPCRETILKEILAIEARRQEPDRMAWSLRTLNRSLGRLRRAGIVTDEGHNRRLQGRWGPTRRSIHLDKLTQSEETLRFAPRRTRECGPRSDRECGPQEVKDFRTYRSKKPQDTHDTSRDRESLSRDVVSETRSVQRKGKILKPPARPKAPEPIKRTPEEAFLTAYRAFAADYDSFEASGMACWILYRALVANTVPQTVSYYTRSAETFFDGTPGEGYKLIEGADRLLEICPRARGLVDAVMRDAEMRQ